MKFSFQKNNCVRILTVIVMLLYMLTMFIMPVNSETVSEQDIAFNYSGGYALCAESNGVKLFLNRENTAFYVLDANGNRYDSYPQQAESDSEATGIFRTELMSHIIVQYLDVESKNVTKINSYARCVMDKLFSVEQIDNGFTVTYNFTEYGFDIPLSVTLEDGKLYAQIDTKAIKENNSKKFMILNISLLPSFGAGAPDEKGYVFIPDGSGAIMEFGNYKIGQSDYRKAIYGADLNQNTLHRPVNTYNINYPVFGIKKQNGGFLAIIEDGAAQGYINCLPNHKKHSFASAYADFVLRGEDTFVNLENTGSPLTSKFYHQGEFATQKITVCYDFLSVSSDYNEMASIYRNYLISKYGFEKSVPQFDGFTLSFYGAVKKKKNFLGIPYYVNQKLSALSDIKDFSSALVAEGTGSFDVEMNYWSRDAIAKKIDGSLRPVSVIGSTKDAVALKKEVNKNGGNLFLKTEIQKFSKSGNGVSSWSDISHSLYNSPVFSYSYFTSTSTKNNAFGRMMYLIPTKYEDVTENINKTLGKKKLDGISLSNGVQGQYSAYSDEFISKTEMQEYLKKSLSEISAPVLMSSPIAEYISGADALTDIPMASGQDRIFDYDVPFVQLVLSGIKNFSCESVNLTYNYSETVLKAIATGSSLHYSLITEDNSLVRDTELNFLYSANAKDWKESIVRLQKSVSDLKEKIGNAYFTAYYITENGSISEYNNGLKIAVDYSEGEAKAYFEPEDILWELVIEKE